MTRNEEGTDAEGLVEIPLNPLLPLALEGQTLSDTDDPQSDTASAGDLFGFHIADLVDLTNDDVCRIRMKRTISGVAIPCACGGAAGHCHRKGHNQKREEGPLSNVAPPRYYPRLETKYGFADGRLDMGPGYTTEEYQALLPTLRNPEEPGGHSLLDRESSPRREELEHASSPPRAPTNRTAGVQLDEHASQTRRHRTIPSNPEPTGRARRNTSTPRGNGIQPLTQGGATAEDIWFGLTDPPDFHTRVICNTMVEYKELLNAGARHEASFLDAVEADEWLTAQPESLQEPAPRPTIRRYNPNLGHREHQGPEQRAYAQGNRPYARRDPEPRRPAYLADDRRGARPGVPGPYARQEVNLRQPLYQNNERTPRVNFSGPDPSTGNPHQIFNQEWEDTQTFDPLLVPDLFDPQTGRDYIEHALDVVALPGTYHGTSLQQTTVTDDLEGLAEVLAHVNDDTRGKRGYDPLWRNRKHNGLSKIKSFKGLMELAEMLLKVQDRAFRTQTNKFTQFLHRHYLSREEIQYELELGGVACLIRATYRHYADLVNTIRDVAYRQGAQHWTGYLAETMLKHHAQELLVIRMNAPTYRDHILETYIFLRDSHAKKFRTETMQTALWNLIIDTQKEESDEPNPREDKPCQHCLRRNLHTGQKSRCPGRMLPGAQARKALVGVSSLSVGRLICNEIKEKLAAGDSDPDAVIADVRKEHL